MVDDHLSYVVKLLIYLNKTILYNPHVVKLAIQISYHMNNSDHVKLTVSR